MSDDRLGPAAHRAAARRTATLRRGFPWQRNEERAVENIPQPPAADAA
jgi:hypothetical protein